MSQHYNDFLSEKKEKIENCKKVLKNFAIVIQKEQIFNFQKNNQIRADIEEIQNKNSNQILFVGFDFEFLEINLFKKTTSFSILFHKKI